MSLKQRFITMRDNYVIHQVHALNIPEFAPSGVHRYKIVFSGRVQHVGFRLEISELAKRLELTGFCQNLKNGGVFAELQGPDNKIQFLLSFMESLKRIKITKKAITEIPLVPNEIKFSKQ